MMVSLHIAKVKPSEVERYKETSIYARRAHEENYSPNSSFSQSSISYHFHGVSSPVAA